MAGSLPYRWVIVAAAAAMLALAMGLLVNGLSVFFIPLEREFGWPRGAIALINSSGLVGLALGGIVMGFLSDRIDVRKVCLIGAVAVGACTFLAARADALWQFYGLFFIAGALGGGALFAPLFALIGNWFRAEAGLAIGIAAAGQAIGQGGIPLGAAVLIESLGWRGTFSVLGILALATLVPLALLMRNPPTEPAGASAADDQSTVLPTPVVVVWMSAATIGCCTCMSVPLMHLVPYIQGQGIAAAEAGSVLFVMLIAAILGRVAFGWLADFIGAIPAYMAASLWQTALVFWFARFDDLAALYAYAPVYGFGYGGVMTGVLITTRALTPAARRGAATGIILAFAWLGHGLGGFQGGYFFDLTGAYTWSFANAALAGLFNLVVVGALYVTIGYRTRAVVAHV